MTLIRLSAAASLIGILAACGGGDPSVRNGPQAVHPSPSALASGVQTTSAPQQVAISNHAQTGYGANDGSNPIID